MGDLVETNSGSGVDGLSPVDQPFCFVGSLLHVIYRSFSDAGCQADENDADVVATVVCSGGKVRLPSALVALVSPLCKAAFEDYVGQDLSTVIVPDLDVSDLQIFLGLAYDFLSAPSVKFSDVLLHSDAVQRVMGLFCQRVNPGMKKKGLAEGGGSIAERPLPSETRKIDSHTEIVRKRTRRKRKLLVHRGGIPSRQFRSEERYVPRPVSTTYDLRTRLKRKRFLDESEEEPMSIEEMVDDSHWMDESVVSDEQDSLGMEHSGHDFVNLGDIPTAWQSDDDESARHVVPITHESCENSGQTNAITSNPRSLLKRLSDSYRNCHKVLQCSECGENFSDFEGLRHHAACVHKGSRFFSLPHNHSHQGCYPCQALVKAVEDHVSGRPKNTINDVFFACPHCRRRFDCDVPFFSTHLAADHGQAFGNAESTVSNKPFIRYKTDPQLTTCEICHMYFADVESVNHHLLQCFGENSQASAMLRCPICGKSVSENQQMKRHLLGHAEFVPWKDFTFFCRSCPLAFSTSSDLEEHLEIDHENEKPEFKVPLHKGCIACNALKASFNENRKTGRIPFRDLMFQCPHCLRLFHTHPKRGLKYLEAHLRDFHNAVGIKELKLQSRSPEVLSKSDKLTFRCDLCHHQSVDMLSFNNHISSCASNETKGRTKSSVTATTRKIIKLHNKNTSTTKGGSSTCGQRLFLTESSAAPEDLFRVQNPEATPSLESPRVERLEKLCPRCGTSHPSGIPFDRHVATCSGRVRCHHCSMDFKHQEDMQAHALIHLGRIACPIHNILFRQEFEVNQHFSTASPDEKATRLRCCMCSSDFKQMSVFMCHLRRHLNILPYKCGVCQKHYYTFAALRVHQKNIHGWGRRDCFDCPKCSKSFVTKGQLKEHISGIHSSTSIKCFACDKTFGTFKRMKKHLGRCHKEVAEQYRAYNKVEVFDCPTTRSSLAQ